MVHNQKKRPDSVCTCYYHISGNGRGSDTPINYMCVFSVVLVKCSPIINKRSRVVVSRCLKRYSAVAITVNCYLFLYKNFRQAYDEIKSYENCLHSCGFYTMSCKNEKFC